MTRTLGSEFPGLHNPDLETECYNPGLRPSLGYITRNSSSSGLYNPNLVRVPGYTPGLYIELHVQYGLKCIIFSSATAVEYNQILFHV